MFGLIITVICAVVMLFTGQVFPQAFAGATDFLLWWYVVTSIISAVFMALAALGLLGIGSVIGGLAKGVQGAVAGFFVGGALAVWSIAVFIFSCVMSIGGAYLLHSSVAINSAGVAEWNFPILIIGAVMLAVKIIWQLAANASSKNNFEKVAQKY